VVPHGADPPQVAPLPDEPTLLFFGRLSYYKGLDVLLDALPAVWERVPAAKLVIAGAGQRPEHPLLADPRVDLRFGHVAESDLPGLFAGATCAVLPYRQASQSGVGSRAKSFGRAAVVTRLGGLPELVSDGSGIAVEPEDPAALAGALVELLTDPERAAAMGRKGADALETGAGWDRVAGLTLDAYRAAGLLRP
jgi:glycosyltransferase involved in cell wall biosynthesis